MPNRGALDAVMTKLQERVTGPIVPGYGEAHALVMVVSGTVLSPKGRELMVSLLDRLMPRKYFLTSITKQEGVRLTEAEEELKGPFVHAEIKIIRPNTIIALGQKAATFLTGVEGREADIRQNSRLRYMDGDRAFPVIASWNPEYVLEMTKTQLKADRVHLKELVDDVRRSITWETE